MASSEYLANLGGNVKPGDKIADVLTARRVNALTDAVRSLTRGDNVTVGPGLSVKKNPSGFTLIANAAPRPNTPSPRMVSVEITLDADTAPTSAQINAALLAFYTDGTVPREGDTFRISRADNNYPEVQVRLTATELGPDWRFSPNSIVEIQEKNWYRVITDISGRSYFESSASKTTTDKGGVEVTNKSGAKTLLIEPASITANMAIRDLPVIVGTEIKLARVVASEPVSQDPVVNLPGLQEYLEGGGIRFLDSDTDAKYITVHLPEIANDDDQDGGTLIKLEYVPAVLPGGAAGVRLKYSSRITDESTSKVRLFTEDEGETWYFDLDGATKTLLAKIATLEANQDTMFDLLIAHGGDLDEHAEAIGSLQNDVSTLQDDVWALQDDVVTLDGRVDYLETRADTAEENQTAIHDLLIDHGGDLDEHAEAIGSLQTAIGGASIDCDESGVTLTWGT